MLPPIISQYAFVKDNPIPIPIEFYYYWSILEKVWNNFFFIYSDIPTPVSYIIV